MKKYKARRKFENQQAYQEAKEIKNLSREKALYYAAAACSVDGMPLDKKKEKKDERN